MRHKLLPHGIPEGYAKAKLQNSEIKLSVQNFAQIQHNIIAFNMNIIQFESEIWCIYIAIFESSTIKKTAREGRFGACD